MLFDIVRLGNLFNFKKFLIVSLLKLSFCKRHHDIKGHETCIYTSFFKGDRSRRRHLTDKFDDRLGYSNTILVRGGGNLNNPIFKSSNARALPGGWGDVEVSS